MENVLGSIADIITIVMFLVGTVLGGILARLTPKFYRKLRPGKDVHIPDAKLHKAIRKELNSNTKTSIPDGKPITKEDMGKLRVLPVGDEGLVDLTGLEYAVNLTAFAFSDSDVSDLRPIAKLRHLEKLECWNNRRITDISPLVNLTELTVLDLEGCRISDIAPLANLTHLTVLKLRGNRIIDVSPLANLNKLSVLELEGNPIMELIENKINPLRQEDSGSDSKRQR